MKSSLLLCLLLLSHALVAQQWRLTGNTNTNPAIHFLGTTDANDVVFRTNNLEGGRILSTGELRWGDAINNALFNTGGDLLFSGTADYLVNGSHYIWRDYTDGDIGSYYDALLQRIEMRNSSNQITSYITTEGQQYIADQISLGSTSFSYKLTVENSTSTRCAYLNNTYNTSSTKYGLYNLVSSLGTGGRYGIYNSSSSNSSSSSTNYGIYNTVSNPGSGNAYGLYSTVSASGTGTHYGIYSSASGSSNYALYGVGRGYFSDRVGIGTNSPSVLLQVNGTDEVARLSGTNPYIKLVNGSDNIGFLWANGLDLTLGTDGNNDAGKIVLRTNTVGRVFVNSSGQVGVGISDPLAKFHVEGSSEVIRLSGSSDPYMQLAQNGINVGYVQANGEDLRIGTNSDNILGIIRLSTSGITRLLIDGDGNVGIGMSNASDVASGYKLSVNGKVMCEELRVELDSNWPDYVFEKDYRLMSIGDLRNFISANKHLPGIPSSENIDAEGLHVGDMQVKLLEKIEELTLYIVQMEQRLTELESR